VQDPAQFAPLYHFLRRRSCGTYIARGFTDIVKSHFSHFASAPQSHSPRDPRQPGLQLPHFSQLLPITQHSHEGFLGGVFSVVVVPERSVGNSVNQPGVIPNHEFQFVFVGSRHRNGWAHHPLSYHSRVLKYEDRIAGAIVHKSF
jgi:hypothetical protein